MYQGHRAEQVHSLQTLGEDMKSGKRDQIQLVSLFLWMYVQIWAEIEMRQEKTAPEGLSQSQIVSVLVFWRLSLCFGTVIGLCDHWDHAGYF